jgi:fructose transport system permease protein
MDRTPPGSALMPGGAPALVTYSHEGSRKVAHMTTSDVNTPETATPTAPAPATAAEQFALHQRSPVQRIQHILHSHPAISPLLVLILSAVVFSVISDNFASARTMSLLFQQVAVIAALAIGQTLVILTAGIDLSVGAITILAMLLSANLAADNGLPGILGIVLGIIVGGLCGLLNGVLITRLNLPPFIVTLGTLSIFTALALLYSGGQSVQAVNLPESMNWLSTVVPLGDFRITTGVLLVAVLAVVVAFVLSQTAWGRHVYSVGNDAEASRLVGIRVKRVLLSVYLVAGIIYGITAWVLIGRAGVASPNAIVDANLQSITAVVIGGTSLFGGRGAIVGTILGALIVGCFQFGLSLAGVNDQWRVLTVGVLIIVAVAIDQWIRRVKV